MSNLKDKRTEAGLTQSKLAEISGVPLRSIQKYETGERDINKAEVMTVLKLAEALDTEIEDLVEL